ncbi:hypothetical protein HK105_204174 [Polyrhizophydium stewartii]|uniref:Uncharacterized protein n=1 Tax=Polyrhizophydium stewartii TaxID=2732419 RepID=A0ABR4NA67_9FUNG|nr:hypothetical protein HK105_004508 [Polyrhizophydium stewartii]
MGQSDKEALLDMGFSPAKVERALRVTKNAGLQVAMDWLFAHADEPDDMPEPAAGGSDAAAGGADDEGEISQEQATAQSLKCDDCGRLFRDSSAAERHAMRTQHVNFSESTTAIKPLTPEEKAERLKELQARLAARREEKRQLEIQETKEREKVRRRTGQEITAAKEKMEEVELKKAFEAKKREKEEERLARERVRAQLEADKRERQRKAEEKKMLAQGIAPPAAAAPAASPAAAAAGPAKTYNEARIQIRANGQSFVHVFQADDTLEKVYEFLVEQTHSRELKLSQTFPRKVLDGADRAKTLKELNLVPSAALMAQ